MSSQVNAPWQSEECFPEKPAGHEYGYFEKGKFVPCSREAVIERCSGLDLPEIELAWHPGAPRLVPVCTAPFLQAALRDREKATLQHNLKIAAVNVLIFCIFGLGTHHHNGVFVLVLFFGFFTGVLPLFENWRELRRFDQIKWDTSGEATPFERYAAWVETRSTTMTWALLAIIGIIGGIQLLVGVDRSIKMAGLVKPEIWNGQWWRLFTAPLLHGNFIHFIFNASALLGLGRLVEALAGRARLAAVFALSAIGGSVFSLFLMPHSISVGASGGLLGLIGFLLVLGSRRRALLPPGFVRAFGINVALVVLMGIVAFSIIDNASHLGGFVCGAAAAAIMAPREGSLPLPPSRQSNIAGIVSISGMACFAFFAACKMLGKI